MPTKSETMNRNRPSQRRMLDIHACLKEGLASKHMRFGEGAVRYNASYFAKKHECSTKTIIRDIEFMKHELKLPIEYSESNYTFYYTQSVSEFPLVTMSEGELAALMVAKASLHQYKGSPYEKELRAALEKLEGALPSEMEVDLDAMSRAVSFRHAGSPVRDTVQFERLADAVMHRKIVTFDYLKPEEAKPERRTAYPLHLTHRGTRWYLVAYDVARNEKRQFVLKRISKLAVTGKTFPAMGFSADEYYRNSFGVFVADGRHEVLLRFTGDAAEVVQEGDWHPTQKISVSRAGIVELTLSVSSFDEIARWVLSFGGDAEAIEPAGLRKRIASMATEAAARHR